MHDRLDSGIAAVNHGVLLPSTTYGPSEHASANGEVLRDRQTNADDGIAHENAHKSISDSADASTGPSDLLSHVVGADWPEAVPAIWDLFIESAKKNPEVLAIASVTQKGECYGIANLVLEDGTWQARPYLRWSYTSFIGLVTRLIHALQQSGAVQGYPILTFLTNGAEFPLIFWAAASLGCTIVPLHPRMLLNMEEAKHVLNRAISASSVEEAIIFTQDTAIADQVLALGVPQKTRIITVDSYTSSTAYQSFAEFLPTREPGDVSDMITHRRTAKYWKLILFTSGTTALPKGIVLDTFKLDRWMLRRRQAVPLTSGDSVLMNLPNNHLFYFFNLLTFPCSGGAMVLSAGFSPQSFPEIMETEKCTHMPMPPALIHAVAQIAKARGVKFTSLKSVSTGGGKLSVTSIKNCLEDIGAAGVEVIYGSTETGAAVTTGVICNAQDIVRHDDASVGFVDVGAEIKICAPGETTPLPRNVEGEVHYGSLVRADGYAGEGLSSAFYADASGQKWFTTGDAATINDEGLVFIVGRIKDMIIRGATNISPAAIELVLAQNAETRDFNVQVVAKLDEVAGEIPIAITQKTVTVQDIERIQATILSHMGPMFLPEEVLTLEQLGLADFPKTMLGKVQKSKLSGVVRRYLEQRDAPLQNGQVDGDDLTSKVQRIWKRTIGHGVDLDAKISDFADSITTMRIRDRIARDFGVKISLDDILSTRTVKEQIDMIQAQLGTSIKRSAPSELVVDDPACLTGKDLIHLAGRPVSFSSTKAFISHEIKKFGLDWEDVQAITPASDFTQILTQADICNTSWSWKFALLAKPGIDKGSLRKALEVLLAHNRILPSFLFSRRAEFGSDVALHVLLRPNQRLFEVVFRDCGSVKTKEELSKLVFKPYEYEMAVLPGLLCHFLLFDIEETGQVGTVMVCHHATMDASYMQLVFDDFDKALGGATTLDQHIPYKVWADSYFSLRTSHEAQLAVRWHVERLQDLSQQRASVFPQLPRPHHFVGSQQHIQQADDNGFHTTFHAKGITNLRRNHPELSAPIIIKTAWSLMNMHRNKTEIAIFSNLQADRRRFPFVPKALELLSPAHTFEAGNVGGITLQDVVNIIPLNQEETLLDFLRRVAADQEELNNFAAAPLKIVLQEIGPVNAEIMLDILRSQIFNWTPGLAAMNMSNPYENYEALSNFIRPSLRLVINVDVGGNDDETVFAQIKSPLFDIAGLESIAHDFEDFVLFLCGEGNWSRRCGDFKLALRAANRSLNDGSRST